MKTKPEEFIENFSKQFDETPPTITLETNFRNLEGWDSMTALMVIAMLDEIYEYQIDPDEFKKLQFVYQLFNLIK